jgi:hypothetical protein
MTLKELIEKITPLPWRGYRNDEEGNHLMAGGERDTDNIIVAEQMTGPDLMLARHAVNMLPKLVAALNDCVVVMGQLPRGVGECSFKNAIAVLAEANNPEVPQ